MTPPLVVRVLPEVGAIDKTFDYLVPDHVRDRVRVGDMVRVVLHGRRVGGWVVAVDVEPPAGVALRPLAKWSGLGPPAELIELAQWAAWRWAGRPASFLKTASPPRLVSSLPEPVASTGPEPPVGPMLEAALDSGRAVVRLPPTADLAAIAAVVAHRGRGLVLCPSAAMVDGIVGRLRRAGLGVSRHPEGWAAGAAGTTVVGTRAAAWAPVAHLTAVLVLDEHDEAHQQEQTPTWHARDVAIERAARAGVPCVLTSPCPSQEALAWGELFTPPRARERGGWPTVEVVDRREEDPRQAGLISPALVRLLRSDQRVICVLNRTGRSRLLACAACRELARCGACGAAVSQPADELVCARCRTTRPVVCLACGATRLKNVRAGITRVSEELAVLVGEPVAEMTASSDPAAATTRVVIGTEAVLQRIDRADAVAFLDLDQELLAPRFRAAEQALALLARAARVVGRSSGSRGPRAVGRLLLQTRLPDHEAVQAAVQADPGIVAAAERARRQSLSLPPFSALAEVSGASAAAYLAALDGAPGLATAEWTPGRWLVRAADHVTLCDALAATKRPSGRLRVEVDPLRV